MFDTHAHLNFPEFLQLDDVLKRALEAETTHITIPGTDLASSKNIVAIAKSHENIYAAVGIHPAEFLKEEKRSSEEDCNALRNLAVSSKKVVAIGEIGLDKYMIFREFGAFNQNIFDEQIRYFKAQFSIAKELNLSVIIHCRQAKKELLPILDELWDSFYENRVVFHCCEADKSLLDYAQHRNIFIGVDGDITYDSAKQRFIAEVPINRLVLETDSPFMMPEPIRETKKFPNEPAHLIHIAEKVAQVKNVPLEEVKKYTFENAYRLFNLTLPL